MWYVRWLARPLLGLLVDYARIHPGHACMLEARLWSSIELITGSEEILVIIPLRTTPYMAGNWAL